jgi:hypothetical protein
MSLQELSVGISWKGGLAIPPISDPQILFQALFGKVDKKNATMHGLAPLDFLIPSAYLCGIDKKQFPNQCSSSGNRQRITKRWNLPVQIAYPWE